MENKNITSSSCIQACLDHMGQHNLAPDLGIIADGEIHRYSVDRNKSKKDEWYIAHECTGYDQSQTFLYCTYGSWSDGTQYIFKSWEGDDALSEDQRKLCYDMHVAQREKAAVAQHNAYEDAAKRAQVIWNSSSDEPHSEESMTYIRRKQIEPIGLKFFQKGDLGGLVIPVKNRRGQIRSLQFISDQKGTVIKKFLSCGEIKGNFLLIGEPGPGATIFITEGYGTAISVYLSMQKQHPVAIAFSAGNLYAVLEQLKKEFPYASLVIAGDSDTRGREGAGKAVQFLGVKALFPEFPPDQRTDAEDISYTDFNDLHALCGLAEVKRQLLDAIVVPAQEVVHDLPPVILTPTNIPAVSVYEPCAVFSIELLPTPLRNYVTAIATTTSADPIMILSSVLATISGFFKTKVYMAEGMYYQNLYPNVWILNVTKSGQFKTTALNKGAKLAHESDGKMNSMFKDLKKQLREASDDKLKKNIEAATLQVSQKVVCLPNKVTTEALLEHLGQGHAGVIFASEFGAWLQNLEQSYNLSLKSMLTELFDVPFSYRYKTRTQGDHLLAKPYISICGVSTMTLLKAHLNINDVSSGFFARFLILVPPCKNNVPQALPTERDPAEIAAYNMAEAAVRAILYETIETTRCYTFSPEARALFTRIHDEMHVSFKRYDERIYEMLDPYIKRWSPYILKVAMILRPFEDTSSTELSESSIIAAESIVRCAMRSTVLLFEGEFGESEHEIKCRKVYDFIARRYAATQEGVLREDLLQSKTLRGGAKDYDFVLTTLIESGKIEEVRHKKKTEWRYVPLSGKLK